MEEENRSANSVTDGQGEENGKSSSPKRRKLFSFYRIVFGLVPVSFALYFAFTRSASFADWFNQTVAKLLRRILSYLTVWIPFSFAEMLLILLFPTLVFLLAVTCRKAAKTKRGSKLFLKRILSAICLILILFVWCFAPGYYGTTLDKKLGLERKTVSAEDLLQTAVLLSAQLKEESENLLFPDGESSSVMPYSLNEMNRKLLTAFESYCSGNDYPDCFYSRIKPIALSKPMTYTHISGVYSFFTGEANLNVNFPDYNLPFTAAHELAHQRGVAREDEANFIAFLVCMESEDSYIRYSGLLNVFEYVASALYEANPKAYSEVYARLPDAVKQEEKAFRHFFDRYRENVAATVSNAANNVYLQSQGASAGTKSYDLVTDLAVAYYLR